MPSTSLRTGQALLPVVSLLFLFSTLGQTAMLTENLQTTSPPAVTNSSLDIQPSNKSISSYIKSPRPCSSENASYCLNGGKCVYHQDNTSPSCICESPYSGDRCMALDINSDQSYNHSRSEELIGIIIGIFMILFALAIIIFCGFHKRCVKSAPLKKPPPETRV